MEDFNDLNTDEFVEAPKPLGAFGFKFGKMTSDMKFVGMFLIVYGVLTSLTIIGALFGIPMVISGLRLREAADELDTFRGTNSIDALRRGFEFQGKFFNIQKILIIIGIVIFVIYIFAIIFLFGTMFSNISQY